jgi:hypothetical protein
VQISDRKENDCPNENDPTFSEGERTGADGKEEDIRVTYGKGQESSEDGCELTRDGKPFGKMRVTWKDAKMRDSAEADPIETAWLFEKTTGLPRRLLPGREDAEPIPRLENFATVSIEGNAEAARIFETGR